MEIWGARDAKGDGEILIFMTLLVLLNEVIDSVPQSCAASPQTVFFSQQKTVIMLTQFFFLLLINTALFFFSTSITDNITLLRQTLRRYGLEIGTLSHTKI